MNNLIATNTHTETLPTQPGWQAVLDLNFSSKQTTKQSTEQSTEQPKTVVSHVKHLGPLRIQRAFYPEENGTCHVYLLHPPGGIVGGDQLTINIEAQRNTETLITTPAANKFYLSKQRYARQNQNIIIQENSHFEWLPQETIVYNSAYVKARTRFDLHHNASLIAWDIICLGRPAANEQFTHGHFNQHIEVWQENKALFIDRCHFHGDSEALREPWGMANQPVNGIMMITHDDKRAVNEIRSAISIQNAQFSVTYLNKIIICRYLGQHVDEAKSLFTQAWKICRPSVSNKDAVIPRIWNT